MRKVVSVVSILLAVLTVSTGYSAALSSRTPVISPLEKSVDAVMLDDSGQQSGGDHYPPLKLVKETGEEEDEKESIIVQPVISRKSEGSLPLVFLLHPNYCAALARVGPPPWI